MLKRKTKQNKKKKHKRKKRNEMINQLMRVKWEITVH